MTFDFSSTHGNPRCLRLTTAQALSLTNISGLHPLGQRCGPDQKVATPTQTATTLNNLHVGLYGFYCPNHGNAATGTGMGFALQVTQ